MAEENKKVPIAYATMPVEVTKEDGTKEIIYRKIHPITTGNAVVVKDKEGNNKVLNRVLRAHEAEMAANRMGLFIKDGKICQRISVTTGTV